MSSHCKVSGKDHGGKPRTVGETTIRDANVWTKLGGIGLETTKAIWGTNGHAQQ